MMLWTLSGSNALCRGIVPRIRSEAQSHISNAQHSRLKSSLSRQQDIQPISQIRRISTQSRTTPHTRHWKIKETISSIHTAVSPSAKETNTPTSQEINNIISSLPIIRHLRSQDSSSPKYTELRAYSSLNPSARSMHLVANSLINKNKLPVDPYLFIKAQDTPRIIATCYIGSSICGHPGYVHGGLNFLLFDDIFARCASLAFGGGAGMTATMSVDFRKPSLPDRVYVYRAEVVKVEGRKVWVQGQMRSLRAFTSRELMGRDVACGDGVSFEEVEGGSELVAEAKALFVRPKFGESMAALFANE